MAPLLRVYRDMSEKKVSIDQLDERSASTVASFVQRQSSLVATVSSSMEGQDGAIRMLLS